MSDIIKSGYTCECGHDREEHIAFGDEYDFNYYQCLIENCPCRQYFCTEDKYYCF